MPFTSQQIVSLACQIAKVQSGMAPQVGQLMNLLLETYAQTMDLDTISKQTVINVTGGLTGVGSPTNNGYVLPPDYLREDQVYYNVGGTIFDLDPIALERYNTAFQGPGVNNYPEAYATDISQQAILANGGPIIYFWPPPAIPLSLNIRYRPQLGPVANPETSNTVPWFQNQLILLKDLAAQAMMLGDDSRKEGLDAEVEKRMRKYLVMKDDKEGYAVRVKLDPLLFRNKNKLKPTKQTSIW